LLESEFGDEGEGDGFPLLFLLLYCNVVSNLNIKR
jgi:hypothetical protein